MSPLPLECGCHKSGDGEGGDSSLTFPHRAGAGGTEPVRG